MKLAYPLIMVSILSFHAAAYADEGMGYDVNKTIPTDVSANPISQLRYDSNTFDLAYKAFVYSGHVDDAFALSLSSVKQKPKSILWRNRLAQTALWSNHIETALEQYTDLIIDFKQNDLIPKTIKLSKQLNRYAELIPLLEYILKSKPNDVTTINDLATAYDYLGQPKRAISILEQANLRIPNPLFLEHLAYIYSESDRYQTQYAIINDYNALYGISVKNALIQAEINYNHSMLKNALSNLTAVPNPKKIIDANFWQTQGDLAWLLGNYNLSYQSYLRLYQIKKIDLESMRRLLVLQSRTRDYAALSLAIQSWNLFHQPNSLLLALSLGIELGAYDQLAILYQAKLSPEMRLILETEPDYWLGQTLLIEHYQSPALAREFLLHAVLKHPDADGLPLTYFSFLLGQVEVFIPEQQPSYWLAALSYWQKNATVNDNWAMGYMSSFLLLDQLDKALLVQNSLGSDVNLKYWNSIYPDILDLLNNNKMAYIIRENNWQRMQQDAFKHSAKDHPFWQAYSGLASYFEPIAVSYQINRYLSAHATTDSDHESLLKWAVDNQKYELSAYLAAYCYPNGVPNWAALKLAMWRNDKTAIYKMITTTPQVLPRKDRTEAALQAGYPSLAQSFAYDAEKNPADYDRYEIMKNVMLASADTAMAATEFEQFSNLQGFREILKAKLYHDPTLSFTPYASIWDAYTNNPGDLANNAYIEQIIGLKIAKETTRNIMTFDLAEHRFLYNTYQIDFKDEYTYSYDITLNAELGINQRSTLDQFILIGGAQDEAIAEITYQPTVRDSLLGQFEFDNYHTGNHIKLGNGKIITGQYEHKFIHEYPGYSIGMIGNINRYAKLNSAIHGKLLTMFPADVTADTTAFMPPNFWQVEAYFKFGNNIAEEYTHRWLPYANLGILYDSVAGKGTDIDLGVAGMVFGRDKLMLYGSRSTINSGISSINFIAGLSYTIYF